MVGVIAGISVLLFGLFFYCHRLRRNTAATAADGKRSESADASAGRLGSPKYGETTAVGPQGDIDAVAEPPKNTYGNPWVTTTAETAGTPLYEIDTTHIGELDGGWRGSEMQTPPKQG